MLHHGYYHRLSYVTPVFDDDDGDDENRRRKKLKAFECSCISYRMWIQIIGIGECVHNGNKPIENASEWTILDALFLFVDFFPAAATLSLLPYMPKEYARRKSQ